MLVVFNSNSRSILWFKTWSIHQTFPRQDSLFRYLHHWKSEIRRKHFSVHEAILANTVTNSSKLLRLSSVFDHSIFARRLYLSEPKCSQFFKTSASSATWSSLARLCNKTFSFVTSFISLRCLLTPESFHFHTVLRSYTFLKDQKSLNRINSRETLRKIQV